MKHSDAIPPISTETVRRIIARIHFASTDECWPFHEASDKYGWILIGSRSYPAHRVVYRLFTGIDPMDRIVCHRCDYKPCVNPNHLYLGTHAENADDVVRRNSQRGRGAGVTPKEHLHVDYVNAAKTDAKEGR